jgi:cyclopropane-fatty-acyl-phospholipid synthase
MGKTQSHIISLAREFRQNNLHNASGGLFSGPINVTVLDRWLTHKLLDNIGKPPLSFILWNDEEITSSDIKPHARIRIGGRNALYKLLLNPELNFGDLYSLGSVDVEGDLASSLVDIYHALERVHGKSLLSNFTRPIFQQQNHPDKARFNIHHHYDIGNEFYKQWLDRAAMQYTCAYFPDPAMTLEQAQTAKMHHICRKLRLRPGQTVVEAGCGWGGFALFMAREYGVSVKAYNISHEQINYAKQQAVATGGSQQVEYIEDDYRNIRGRFDVFVSVGMLEHVGIENYQHLGTVIDNCLKEQGRGLIHTIGRNRPVLLNAWIATRIFPGACPPSLSQMMNVFEPREFSILDIENLRLHYAKTLGHWLARFDQNIEQFRKNFDEEFIRTWRLYLAGSIAAFTSGNMQLFQVLFSRPHNNDLDWSRAYLYQHNHLSIQD